MLARILLRSYRQTLPHRLPSSTTPFLYSSATQPRSNFPLRHASHSSRSPVDSKIEDIQELYATARDEFEIASEETQKKTVYAADDRAAAQEELAKLKAAFEKAVAEEGGEEIRSRVGGRIRELERAVEAMEEMAMED